jgi:hypothetical protein
MLHSGYQCRWLSVLPTLLTILPQSYAQAPPSPTIVEDSPALPAPPQGTLGMAHYKPTQKEAAFFSKLKSLSLIRAYGVVMSEENSIPVVQADYAGQWDWGRFTFLMVYGPQKGNKQWKKLNKVKEDKI